MLFDGCFPPSACLPKIIGMKTILQWLRPEMGEQWVGQHLASRVVMPDDGTKAARVMEAHFHTAIDAQNKVVMFLEVHLMWADT